MRKHAHDGDKLRNIRGIFVRALGRAIGRITTVEHAIPVKKKDRLGQLDVQMLLAVVYFHDCQPSAGARLSDRGVPKRRRISLPRAAKREMQRERARRPAHRRFTIPLVIALSPRCAIEQG